MKDYLIKKKWLDHMYYVVARQTPIFLQIHQYKGYCSKWRPYLEVIENQKFVVNANHRTVLFNEIALDFDGEEAELLYNDTLEYLQTNPDFTHFRAFQGCKHIHIYYNPMFYMSSSERAKFRAKVIYFFSGDMAKKVDRNMIALENTPHWKRGDIKKLYAQKGVFNEK